jgi:hypothetical protein
VTEHGGSLAPRLSNAPPKRPRLVATDLDGTLLRPDGAMSSRTSRVLAALPGVGIEVLVVTARPPRWLVPVAALGHGTVICLNGALVLDVATSRAVEVHPMDDDLVAGIVADLRHALPGSVFAAETPDGMRAEHGFEGWQTEHLVRASRLEEVLDGTTGKLLARCGGVPDDALVAQVRRVVAGRAQVHDSGAAGLAEIAAVGVTKAATLARWAAARGIDAADVWAFGDMPNDLEMLTWAGRGVAVANAHQDVLAAADEVCGPNSEDGVAARLEPLLAGRWRGSGP